MNLNVTGITNVLVCKKTHRKLLTTVQRGGGYFPYILLNEIQTMFSQLDSRFVYWSCALCQKPRISGFEKEQNMAFEGGTVSQNFIRVTY